MPPDVLAWNVLAAAASVGVLHTAVGPDHYVPFVALARARRWPLPRTLAVTALCGVGHVLGSLVLGAALLALGHSLGLVEALDAGRGTLAAWALVGFGLAYALWGLRRAWRGRADLELHAHDEHGGDVHLHRHGHAGHTHAARQPRTERGPTFWALLIVFVLGPCEVLVPLVFLPASQGRWGLAGVTALVFGLTTVATMTALVAVAHAGTRRLSLRFLERWAHALAGAVLSLSGVAVLLGL